MYVPVHVMKAYGGVEVQFHSYLNFVLDGGEWSAPFFRIG